RVGVVGVDLDHADLVCLREVLQRGPDRCGEQVRALQRGHPGQRAEAHRPVARRRRCGAHRWKVGAMTARAIVLNRATKATLVGLSSASSSRESTLSACTAKK